jgi:cyclohexanone monooxygenase
MSPNGSQDQKSRGTNSGGDIDAGRLRERYEAERALRLKLRERGDVQPVERGGRLARFGDDLFAPSAAERAPRRGRTDVLIIGAGFGGLLAAVQLRKAGFADIVLVDVAADVGGTWYWNRYPGIRCDTESYIYLPLLEETGFMPSERYAPGAEILDYARLLARRYDLYDRALFQTRVTGLEWRQGQGRWRVETDRGDELDARFVITQSGLFGRPQLPAVPGLTSFGGAVFHTSRWDYGVTGGTAAGDLDRLADLDVGIVGTGCTGLQIIPHLAAAARSLTVFQRTAIQVAVRGNAPTDGEWFARLAPGWQARRTRAFDDLTTMTGKDESEIYDGWTAFARHQLTALRQIPAGERSPGVVDAALEQSDFAWNERLRAQVDDIVRDPRKAALLKAYYRTHCKRPGYSDDYLQAFNRANVTIVDVAASPIERIERDALVTSDRRYPLDVLVLATGFHLGSSWGERAGYDIVGRDGVTLSQKWKEEVVTYHGFHVHGFPNMFFMGPHHVAATPNVTRLLTEQTTHFAFILGHMRDHGHATVEATAEAEAEWSALARSRGEEKRQLFEQCTPGYVNNQGRLDTPNAVALHRYSPATEYFDLIAGWRAAGRFEGLAFGTS